MTTPESQAMKLRREGRPVPADLWHAANDYRRAKRAGRERARLRQAPTAQASDSDTTEGAIARLITDLAELRARRRTLTGAVVVTEQDLSAGRQAVERLILTHRTRTQP